MSGLVVSGVTKAFADRVVLRGIDLDVTRGSVCAILGPSGSGKTTLLRIIAGFERADDGRVSLGEIVLEGGDRRVPPDRRGIGYVPQDGSLFPHLTVADNVGFGLERRLRRSARVDELLSMVGLAGLGRRYPHQLSGGQQQRVALARALAVGPSLVLLDEPFSSLDAGLRQQVRQDVRRVLADAGATVVLVTHDQDEALSLADEVAIMDDGEIGQIGTPSALYRDPRTPALARGLGEANFLPGVVRGAVVHTALGPLSLARHSHVDGEHLLVLVRPEWLGLVPAGPDVPVATVLGREYYGHDAIVRLRGEWGGQDVRLTVRLSDATALPTIDERVGVSVRATVIGWPLEAVELCPDARGGRAGAGQHEHTVDTSRDEMLRWRAVEKLGREKGPR